ncbi:alpha/beta hydrolase [uncultured Flavobacterium sp.]|jgi:alpha-beta hydrolase superfamily lysophospholipase|uniref:alpha/beta hydrolase n=1 Tax=uncultured Flavobacterium sp. TaxID=165435 RepID=UPI0030EB3CD4|tara:strand:+ start:87973 stop:88899 length:927 start_codon:yes stop_codon:yes gene_type:complete
MNIDKDFTFQTIKLTPDYDGEAIATLISSKQNLGNRKSVLYLHGYNDYFFHAHVAEKFNENNFDFYAIDLQKYGRSLLTKQHPNYCKDIEEYFEEISIVIRQINDLSKEPIYLLGHSTGGLTASSYMNTGAERNRINALILNSPFLDFYQSGFEKFFSYWGSKIISTIAPYAKIEGALPPVYAQSLYKDYSGEWDYNLDWKPIKGFPTFFKWVVAISIAQKKLAYSNIKVPILVMHSSGSKKITTFSEEAMTNDTVLNIEDIKRVGVTLGDDVTLLKIDNALHDIFLSPKPVREIAFEKMFSWLLKIQ